MRRSSVTAERPVVEGPDADPGFDVPAEPDELRAAMRQSVFEGADWQERWGRSLGVGDVLWAQWGPRLEAAGMDRRAFDDVVLGYRRELWFWLLGERTWELAATGLAGRLRRRLPSS